MAWCFLDDAVRTKCKDLGARVGKATAGGALESASVQFGAALAVDRMRESRTDPLGSLLLSYQLATQGCAPYFLTEGVPRGGLLGIAKESAHTFRSVYACCPHRTMAIF